MPRRMPALAGRAFGAFDRRTPALAGRFPSERGVLAERAPRGVACRSVLNISPKSLTEI